MIRGFPELVIPGPRIICNQLVGKIGNMSGGRLVTPRGTTSLLIQSKGTCLKQGS